MSKSLKNFITIDEISRKYNYQLVRLYFLSMKWCDNTDFSFEQLEPRLVFAVQLDLGPFPDAVSRPIFCRKIRVLWYCEGSHHAWDECSSACLPYVPVAHFVLYSAYVIAKFKDGVARIWASPEK